MRSVPKQIGGTLIRQLIRFLRENETGRSSAGSGRLSSQILSGESDAIIACSGGSDSLALAQLLVKYGHKVVAPKRLAVLHINHGWRGAESDADEAFVREWAARNGVRFLSERVTKPTGRGESLEAAARAQRQAVYARLAKAPDSWILTGHTADDQAETLLWRICTGAGKTHGGGIAFRHENELRPLLFARKEQLRKFLREEKQEWREDATNHDGRLMRSKLRVKIMTELEAVFPRAVDHLSELALQAQKQSHSSEVGFEPSASLLLGAAGLAAGRWHRKWITRIHAAGSKQIDLPGGWKLRHAIESGKSERWILQRELGKNSPVLSRGKSE